jgi:hypothetical protein
MQIQREVILCVLSNCVKFRKISCCLKNLIHFCDNFCEKRKNPVILEIFFAKMKCLEDFREQRISPKYTKFRANVDVERHFRFTPNYRLLNVAESEEN